MKKEKSMDTNSDLLNFKWDDSDDFFVTEEESNNDIPESKELKDNNEEDNSSETEKKESKNNKNENNKKDNTDDDEKENSKEEKEEGEEEDTDVFKEFIKKDKNKNEKNSDDKENSNEITSYASNLKEKGILTTDFNPEDIEDEDDLLALQQKEIQNRVEKSISDFVENFEEEGKLFIKYVKEGGKPKEFFKVLQETTRIPTYEEDNDSNNAEVIRYYLKNIKDIDDPEDIEDTISTLKEKGTLEKYANKYSNVLEKIKKEKEEQQLELIKKQNEEVKKNKKKFEKDISEVIDKTDDIYGIGVLLSKKEKKDLKEYIFKPHSRINNNEYISKFTQDLKDIFSKPDKLIKLAKLIYEDFDFTNISEKLESNVTKKVKTKINKYTKPNDGFKQLADYFND